MLFCITKMQKHSPQKPCLTPGAAADKQNSGRRCPTSALETLQPTAALPGSSEVQNKPCWTWGKILRGWAILCVHCNHIEHLSVSSAGCKRSRAWVTSTPGLLCWSVPLRLASLPAKWNYRMIKTLPTLASTDKMFPARTLLTGIRRAALLQLNLCSQPQRDWAAPWVCFNWSKVTEKTPGLHHITLRPTQLRRTMSVLGFLKPCWNTNMSPNPPCKYRCRLPFLLLPLQATTVFLCWK